MRTGRLIHKVKIQAPIESKGAMGGTDKQWVKFHECRGRVQELSGQEGVQSDQVVSKIIATCIIRYRENINASMRLVHDGKFYQIESIINKDGKSIWLELPLYEFR